jgi:hypothetical protein
LRTDNRANRGALLAAYGRTVARSETRMDKFVFPLRNHLLAELPGEARERLFPRKNVFRFIDSAASEPALVSA